MRFSALLAAFLLAAPFVAGCADEFMADAPPAEATVAAAQAMHCASLTGPDPVAPGASASYAFDIGQCGTLTDLTFSITGDGTIQAVPWFGTSASASGPQPVTVQAANVSYGSFTLTASFTYWTSFGVLKSSSISKTVTVGTPPPPSMTLTLSFPFNGIRASWANVPASADRLELTIEHTYRGQGIVDVRTVTVTGQTSYLDTQHVQSSNGMSLVAYRLKAYDGAAEIASASSGTYGEHLAVDW